MKQQYMQEFTAGSTAEAAKWIKASYTGNLTPMVPREKKILALFFPNIESKEQAPILNGQGPIRTRSSSIF